MAEIDHPQYYRFNVPAYEVADMTVNLPHPIGSAIEYLYRAGKKPGNEKLEDLRKAKWWIDRYIRECVCDTSNLDEIF